MKGCRVESASLFAQNFVRLPFISPLLLLLTPSLTTSLLHSPCASSWMLSNRRDSPHCILTLGWNSCSCLFLCIIVVSRSALRPLTSHFCGDTVMQWDTRATLGPSERHQWKGAWWHFLIWPQNLLAYSCFLYDSLPSSFIVPWRDRRSREVPCEATAEEPQPWTQTSVILYSMTLDEDLCVLTCLWKVLCRRQCTSSHGAAGLDTEELPGPAGESGARGWGGAKWHTWGVCRESRFMFSLLI